MNIFLHELRAYRKSTIGWTITLTGITVLFSLLFLSIFKEMDLFKTALKNFPPEYLKILSMSVDSITSVICYYSFTFMYVLLCGGIQAMMLGTSVLSKEVRDKTADFLMTKPVSRSAIITSKILAVLASILITNAVYLIITFSFLPIIGHHTESYDSRTLFLIAITLLFVQLIFLALGILVSVLAKKIKSVMAVSLGTVFGFFIINMMSSFIGDDKVRYISPFNYFNTSYIIQHKAYEARFLVIAAVFIVLSVAASYVVYLKKDVHSV